MCPGLGLLSTEGIGCDSRLCMAVFTIICYVFVVLISFHILRSRSCFPWTLFPICCPPFIHWFTDLVHFFSLFLSSSTSPTFQNWFGHFQGVFWALGETGRQHILQIYFGKGVIGHLTYDLAAYKGEGIAGRKEAKLVRLWASWA